MQSLWYATNENDEQINGTPSGLLLKTQNMTASSGSTTFSGNLQTTGKVNGMYMSKEPTNPPLDRVAHISETGVLEGGRYFDWHFDLTNIDYISRTSCNSLGDLTHTKKIAASGLDLNDLSGTFGSNFLTVLRPLIANILFPMGSIIWVEGTVVPPSAIYNYPGTWQTLGTVTTSLVTLNAYIRTA